MEAPMATRDIVVRDLPAQLVEEFEEKVSSLGLGSAPKKKLLAGVFRAISSGALPAAVVRVLYDEGAHAKGGGFRYPPEEFERRLRSAWPEDDSGSKRAKSVRRRRAG